MENKGIGLYQQMCPLSTILYNKKES